MVCWELGDCSKALCGRRDTEDPGGWRGAFGVFWMTNCVGCLEEAAAMSPPAVPKFCGICVLWSCPYQVLFCGKAYGAYSKPCVLESAAFPLWVSSSRQKRSNSFVTSFKWVPDRTLHDAEHLVK